MPNKFYMVKKYVSQKCEKEPILMNSGVEYVSRSSMQTCMHVHNREMLLGAASKHAFMQATRKC